MFERFGSLPLHVLVIHLAVVVLPVSALTAIAFAVLPKWRWLLRWPALVLGLGALVCAFVAKKSGDAFVAAIPQLQQLVKVHRSRGNLLLWFVLAFAVLVVIAFLRRKEIWCEILLEGRDMWLTNRTMREAGVAPCVCEHA